MILMSFYWLMYTAFLQTLDSFVHRNLSKHIGLIVIEAEYEKRKLKKQS